jgi:hypothetical protein
MIKSLELKMNIQSKLPLSRDRGFNSEQNVEECDARDDDHGTKAG